MTRHLAIPSSTPWVSVILPLYRDAMEQAIRKWQLQRPYRYPFLLFPPGSMIFALLMLIWSFHLVSDRSKRSHRVARYIPSSGPNGEGRAPELIDCPHSPLKSQRWYKTQERGAQSYSARIAAADLAARSSLQFNGRALKGNTSRLEAWLGPLS